MAATPYSLGTRLMALGAQALASTALYSRVRPILRSLASKTGETATLEVRADGSMLVLDQVTGRHMVGTAGHVGTSAPMNATSSGKA